MEFHKRRHAPCHLGEHVGEPMLPSGCSEVPENEDSRQEKSRCRPCRLRLREACETEDVKDRQVKDRKGGQKIFTDGSFRCRGREGKLHPISGRVG
jgi:hypothetical protein